MFHAKSLLRAAWPPIHRYDPSMECKFSRGNLDGSLQLVSDFCGRYHRIVQFWTIQDAFNILGVTACGVIRSDLSSTRVLH